MTALHPPAPVTERLARFEIACEALWPSIRFFGLCGCSPEKLALILEIGDLLGKTTHTPQAATIDADALIRAAKQDALEEVASIVESSPEFWKGCGRNLAKEQADKIRKLQLSSEA